MILMAYPASVNEKRRDLVAIAAAPARLVQKIVPAPIIFSSDDPKWRVFLTIERA